MVHLIIAHGAAAGLSVCAGVGCGIGCTAARVCSAKLADPSNEKLSSSIIDEAALASAADADAE